MEFVLDCKPPGPKAGGTGAPAAVALRGSAQPDCRVELGGGEPARYERFLVSIRGREVTVRRGDKEVRKLTLAANAPTAGALGLSESEPGCEWMNLYVRRLSESK